VLRWQPPVPGVEKANIVIFGVTGSGKSSLLNQLLSVWDKAKAVHAAAMNSGDHVTTQSEVYWGKGQFQFLDTVGLSEDTYQSEEFEKILKGSLPVGHKIGESVRTSHDKSKEFQPHAIIFVAPFGYIFEDEDANAKRLHQFILQAGRLGFPPLLVITRADEVTSFLALDSKQSLPFCLFLMIFDLLNRIRIAQRQEKIFQPNLVQVQRI